MTITDAMIGHKWWQYIIVTSAGRKRIDYSCKNHNDYNNNDHYNNDYDSDGTNNNEISQSLESGHDQINSWSKQTNCNLSEHSNTTYEALRKSCVELTLQQLAIITPSL